MVLNPLLHPCVAPSRRAWGGFRTGDLQIPFFMKVFIVNILYFLCGARGAAPMQSDF